MEKVRAHLIGKVLRGVDVEGVRKEEIRNMEAEVRVCYERLCMLVFCTVWRICSNVCVFVSFSKIIFKSSQVQDRIREQLKKREGNIFDLTDLAREQFKDSRREGGRFRGLSPCFPDFGRGKEVREKDNDRGES